MENEEYKKLNKIADDMTREANKFENLEKRVIKNENRLAYYFNLDIKQNIEQLKKENTELFERVSGLEDDSETRNVKATPVERGEYGQCTRHSDDCECGHDIERHHFRGDHYAECRACDCEIYLKHTPIDEESLICRICEAPLGDEYFDGAFKLCLDCYNKVLETKNPISTIPGHPSYNFHAYYSNKIDEKDKEIEELENKLGVTRENLKSVSEQRDKMGQNIVRLVMEKKALQETMDNSDFTKVCEANHELNIELEDQKQGNIALVRTLGMEAFELDGWREEEKKLEARITELYNENQEYKKILGEATSDDTTLQGRNNNQFKLLKEQGTELNMLRAELRRKQ